MTSPQTSRCGKHAPGTCNGYGTECVPRHTPEELRAAAAEADARAEESFKRSDTDGFLSQWASGITARLYREQAAIEEDGGRIPVPALFDAEGNLVAARLVSGRYGVSWGLLPSDDPHGRFTGWFRPSKARTAARRQAADAARGYQVGLVRAQGKAEIMGSGTGLSGAASCYVGRRRADGGFSRDVEIILVSDYRDR